MGERKNVEAMTQTPRGIRAYLQSLAISFSVVLIVGGIATAPHCSWLWDLFLPGALLAALLFPQGVNSNGGNAYLIVAGLLDIVLLAFIVMWLLTLYERRRKPKG